MKGGCRELFKSKVKSYIYNVDDFKFYFYRADFSPLKLCLEWQSCFYY